MATPAFTSCGRQKRALLIGNNNYQQKQNVLRHCINDASDMGNVLKRINFTVTTAHDLTRQQMVETIGTFRKSVADGDLVLLFFSGHGRHVHGLNYLIPVDDKHIETNEDVQDNAISVNVLLQRFSDTNQSHATIFILDCCRIYRPDSAPKLKGGSSKIDDVCHGITTQVGTYVHFACDFNQTASDGFDTDRNGVFTRYLLEHISTPNQDLFITFSKVSAAVYNATNGKQKPVGLNGLMLGEHIYLNSNPSNSPQGELSSSRIQITTMGRTINMLLLGEQGTGKSTFLNALVNYLHFETIEQAQSDELIVLKSLTFGMTSHDSFETHLVQLDEFSHQSQSNTHSCQTYTWNLRQDGRRKLCLIDTPSFLDGPQFDQTNADNITHILDYVNNLKHLNAICLLLQPDASRLSSSFQSCFVQLLKRLGTNARQNVIFCFTNALKTFSMPGSTASLLRNMFSTHSMTDMPFSRMNTFFFENESFRYLIALQNGIQFNREDHKEYITSWSECVLESKRLLNYVSTQVSPCPIVKN